MQPDILCVAVTPALERNLLFDAFQPGVVNRARKVTKTQGGKGVNVAVALSHLQDHPLLAGFLGQPTGNLLNDLLQKLDITCHWVKVTEDTRTCTNIIDQATGQVTVLVEEATSPTPAAWERFHNLVATWLPKVKAVVLCGALPPGTSSTLYHDYAKLASEHEVLCLVDSQKEPMLQALSARPTLAKMNDHELASTLGQDMSTLEAIDAGSLEVLQRGAQWVLITRGGDTAVLRNEQTHFHLQPPKITVLQPVGSGDATTAGIASGLTKGLNMVEAVRFGMACGAASATSLSPAFVEPSLAQKLTGEIVIQEQ